MMYLYILSNHGQNKNYLESIEDDGCTFTTNKEDALALTNVEVEHYFFSIKPNYRNNGLSRRGLNWYTENYFLVEKKLTTKKNK